MKKKYSSERTLSFARRLKLAWGDRKADTPLFMPDATRGFVKSLGNQDLKKVGVGPLVVNTYHLYLQPGIELIKKAGGIHSFMNWDEVILSDSGGYQIFSLIHKNPALGKITDEGAVFKSPLDGSKHAISPEKTIEIQFDLGSEMMVVLDDCPPNHYSYEKIKEAVERTIVWAKRGKAEYERQLKARSSQLKNRPLLFGVIQGGTYKELRRYCAEELVKIGFDGLGFGARHHDSEGFLMEDLLEFTANLIPQNYLRFALGVGVPEDIVKCVLLGWDMFDCVIPTREGRHGKLFRFKDKNPGLEKLAGDFYQTINIHNEKYKEDFSPVDENCDCELCRGYSRSYLRHLFLCGDPLAMRLAALHNLRFYVVLMEILKREAEEKRFLI